FCAFMLSSGLYEGSFIQRATNRLRAASSRQSMREEYENFRISSKPIPIRHVFTIAGPVEGRANADHRLSTRPEGEKESGIAGTSDEDRRLTAPLCRVERVSHVSGV